MKIMPGSTIMPPIGGMMWIVPTCEIVKHVSGDNFSPGYDKLMIDMPSNIRIGSINKYEDCRGCEVSVTDLNRFGIALLFASMRPVFPRVSITMKDYMRAVAGYEMVFRYADDKEFNLGNSGFHRLVNGYSAARKMGLGYIGLRTMGAVLQALSEDVAIIRYGLDMWNDDNHEDDDAIMDGIAKAIGETPHVAKFELYALMGSARVVFG